MKTVFACFIFTGWAFSPFVMFHVIDNKYAQAKQATELRESYLGEFKVTSYRSIKGQTDNSPNWSSIGIHTNPWMVAVSRDLLRDGRLKYNDLVYIEGIGFKVVGDAMNARFRNSMDVWVETLKEEQDFHRAFKNRKLKVWLVKRGDR